jgi:branched-chain amino acid transport system substrate-binding protein
MKRLSLLIGLLIVMGLLVTACRPAAPATIKIGLNAELTGGVPVVGASCKNGAELAVEEVNNAGGLEVGGKKYKIELLIEDNESLSEKSW